MIVNLAFFFLLGIIFGSFLNSLIYRLHEKLPLGGRSFCVFCKKQLLKRDLIPLLSFLYLKAKCRFCREKISWQYFWVELIAGILFILVFLKYENLNLFLARDLFFILVLIFIFIYDLRFKLVLDQLVFPVLIIATLLNFILGFTWLDLLTGILIGGGFFALQYLSSKGRSIGLGDIKLGILLGGMFGWQMIILIILLAYLIGGIIAIILLINKKKNWGDFLPMGSFLAISAIIVLLYGELIWQFIYNL
ncbi:MAG: prepilin peptidase [Candidatus Buchananbacteria bacterium]|nr:prepilin peptidase [Candidatus Buchananbacteria bacterium]